MARTVKQKHGGSIKLREKGDAPGPGRPPKLLTTIVADLRARGYERATSTSVLDAFETLLNVPQSDLEAMVNDAKLPMSVRIVGKAMLSPRGWEVLQSMIDRAHGKARNVLVQPVSEDADVKRTSIELPGGIMLDL
jgi:hypothetical protein